MIKTILSKFGIDTDSGPFTDNLKFLNVTSADANTMDYFVKGVSFTPTLTFGGASTGMTGTFGGKYTRIGDRVLGTLSITLTAKGSATGTAAIGNLPFTSSASVAFPTSFWLNNITSGVGDTHLSSLLQASSKTINFYKMATGTATLLTHADFTDTSIIRVDFSYQV